jgi:hypothetical protein
MERLTPQRGNLPRDNNTSTFPIISREEKQSLFQSQEVKLTLKLDSLASITWAILVLLAHVRHC